MNIIVVNQNDIITSTNNVFRFKFRNSTDLKDYEISLASASLYYSWYNISSALMNNTFYITTRVGSTNTKNSIIIPDGIYNITDVNEYIQQWSINNGFYLINSDGDFVYFIQMVVNPNLYVIDLITYPVPTSLPSGYTEPSNWIGYPDDYYNPIVEFPSKFNEIVGYTADFATDLNLSNNILLSYQSSTSPDIAANTETILVSIDNIDNKYTNQSGIIYALTATVNAGQVIYERPSNFIFSPFIPGVYSDLYIRLLDTNYQPIHIVDPNMTFAFVIKRKNL